MKKKMIVFLVLLCSGLIMNYAVDNYNFKHITTDSGFDVGYDSGSSGSSSFDSGGSSSSSGSSYASGSDGSSGGSGGGSYPVIGTFIFSGICLLISIIIVFRVLIRDIKHRNKSYKEYTPDKYLSKKDYTYTTDERWPKDPNDRKLLEDAYNIFVDVQNAWTNFDYKKLRELVTDDLYNMYYNQLQTLSIKGEKNIMENFDLKDSYIYSKSFNKEKNINYYYIRIKVSFYDYIVDSNNNIIRGKKDKLVNMEYELTFVKNESVVDTCPVCKAKLENGITTCPYCRSHIQGVSSKMKLSKKKALKQW